MPVMANKHCDQVASISDRAEFLTDQELGNETLPNYPENKQTYLEDCLVHWRRVGESIQK